MPADPLYIGSGPPGSGKTTFSAHFITEGAVNGENCLSLTVHVTPAGPADDLGRYSFGFDRVLASDQVGFLDVCDEKTKRPLEPPNGDSFTSGVDAMTARLVTYYFDSTGIERVVIASTMLPDYYFADDSDAFVQFLTSLVRIDATTLVTSKLTDPTSYGEEHYHAHGVVSLRGGTDASEPGPTDAQGLPGVLGRADPGGPPTTGSTPSGSPSFSVASDRVRLGGLPVLPVLVSPACGPPHY